MNNIYRFKDFSSLTDEQAVKFAMEGDEKAMEYIIDKYKPLVKSRANMYYLIGADKDDIIQEGMIGLFKAVKCYKADQSTCFKAFADMCIRRQIITAIKTATRQKHIPLNTYISLNKPVYEEDADRTVVDLLDYQAVLNPEDIIIGKEQLKNMEKKIVHMLSAFEMRVLRLYLLGRTYQDIARIVNKSVKSIDNALQRVKRKLEYSLEGTGS